MCDYVNDGCFELEPSNMDFDSDCYIKQSIKRVLQSRLQFFAWLANFLV